MSCSVRLARPSILNYTRRVSPSNRRRSGQQQQSRECIYPADDATRMREPVESGRRRRRQQPSLIGRKIQQVAIRKSSREIPRTPDGWTTSFSLLLIPRYGYIRSKRRRSIPITVVTATQHHWEYTTTTVTSVQLNLTTCL